MILINPIYSVQILQGSVLPYISSFFLITAVQSYAPPEYGYKVSSSTGFLT